MKAETGSQLATARAGSRSTLGAGDTWREVVFSVAQARCALPYIARVACDAAEAFNTVQRCRRLLDRAASRRARLALCERRDHALQRLNRAIDDGNAAGAHLVDLERGIVSFQCEADGRLMCLLWDIGQPIDGAWREIDSSGDHHAPSSRAGTLPEPAYGRFTQPCAAGHAREIAAAGHGQHG